MRKAVRYSCIFFLNKIITVAIDTKNARFETLRHKRAVPEVSEFSGVSKTTVCFEKAYLASTRIQLFYFIKLYTRHAFLVFRKSSPAGLTMLY